MPAPECRCAEAAYQAGLRDAAAEIRPTPELAARVAELLEPWLKVIAEAARPRLVTIAEAADQLGVSRTKAYELMYKGELASVELPGRNSKQAGRRIEQAEIDAFIARNRVSYPTTGSYGGQQ